MFSVPRADHSKGIVLEILALVRVITDFPLKRKVGAPCGGLTTLYSGSKLAL